MSVEWQNLGCSLIFEGFFGMHHFALSRGSVCQKYRGKEPLSTHFVKEAWRELLLCPGLGHKAKTGWHLWETRECFHIYLLCIICDIWIKFHDILTLWCWVNMLRCIIHYVWLGHQLCWSFSSDRLENVSFSDRNLK